MNKFTAYIMIGLARILGGMSLLVFMIFLFVGSLNLFDMRLDESEMGIFLNSYTKT